MRRLVDIGFALQVQTAARHIRRRVSTDCQGSSRSTVAFQAQASGFLKALLCVVTVSGRLVGRGAARIVDVAEARRWRSAGTAGCRPGRPSR